MGAVYLMKVDLKAVESLAPDQSSLKAAAGLVKPTKWSGAGVSSDGQLIWAACAGSGANPYRVMADLADLGNKCTCPSRKFPCKHVLALLWMRADDTMAFVPAEVPDWVSEWLGRRRKTGGAAAATPAAAGSAPAKDMRAAVAVETETPEDPKDIARKAAAAEKRAAETEQAMDDAVDALEGWVSDQLRLGLASFIDDATARCRRIAARLVDGKAATLAGRIDELPARLLAMPAGDRVRGAVIELGKLILLARAFRAEPKNAEIRRSIAAAENREALLENPATLRVSSTWEIVGEKVETRRDGLVSQTSWLLNLGGEGPSFAVLLDYYPASAGKRGSVFTVGEQFDGELAFYPARNPERALLLSRTARDQAETAWPCMEPMPLAKIVAKRLDDEPWLVEMPILLPPGRIMIDANGTPWWKSLSGDDLVPVEDLAEGPARATDLACAAAVWSARGLRVLAAQTAWGRLNCVG